MNYADALDMRARRFEQHMQTQSMLQCSATSSAMTSSYIRDLILSRSYMDVYFPAVRVEPTKSRYPTNRGSYG